MKDGTSVRGRRPVIVALVVLAVAILGAVAWVGVRAVLVKAEFDAALPIVDGMRDAASNGDFDRVEALAPELEARATAAASLTGDPVWRAAEITPMIGANLTAVRVVSAELERVSGALPVLLDSLEAIAAGGASAVVDIDDLSAAADPLSGAAAELAEASERLGALDTSVLIGPVARGTQQMQEATAMLAPAVATAADIARTLPPTLGEDGPRSLLVMLQNSAELRTGGGITGTFAEIRAESGTLTLVRQADSSSFPARSTPVAPVPESTTALYSDKVGRFVQNTSMPADFDTTAQLASAWWKELTGRTPDTVISVDPFVLQALLSVTGPVDLGGGRTLDAENFVQTLLVDPYLTLDSAQQSALFSAAVESVFARVTAGGLDPVALVQTMSAPVAEGRVAVWSAHAAENDIFRAGILGGPSARQALAGPGAFAVYFNDATGAKLAGYLDVSMSADVLGCHQSGLAVVAVTVTIGSDAPADLGSWPVALTGGGLFGVGAGDIGTNISVSAPPDAYLGGVIVKGEAYPAATATDAGHPSAAARVNLSPGEVNTLEYRFTVPEDAARSIQLIHTPLMNDPAITVESGCP